MTHSMADLAEFIARHSEPADWDCTCPACGGPSANTLGSFCSVCGGSGWVKGRHRIRFHDVDLVMNKHLMWVEGQKYRYLRTEYHYVTSKTDAARVAAMIYCARKMMAPRVFSAEELAAMQEFFHENDCGRATVPVRRDLCNM